VGTSDILPQREIPTSEVYRAYQNGSIGGRYERVFVHKLAHLGFGLEEHATTPKEWLGSPIIVFRQTGFSNA